MKKLVLFLLVLAISLNTLFAQDNRISLRVNYLSSISMKGNVNDSMPKYNSKLLHLFPSIGFYHTFKNNVGLGIELGYRYSNQSINSEYHTYQAPLNTYTRQKLTYQSYYISPSVYETFCFRNFIANIGLIIPIEYISKYENRSDRLDVNTQTNAYAENIEYTKEPPIVQYSILVQAAIYRKVFKNLYAGVEMAIGPSFENKFGKGEGYHYYLENGVQVTNVPLNTSKKEFRAELISLPTFSIQYRFSKK